MAADAAPPPLLPLSFRDDFRSPQLLFKPSGEAGGVTEEATVAKSPAPEGVSVLDPP